MNEPEASPVQYHVAYSERVRGELVRLAARARACGLGVQFLDAVKEIDQRLRIYPQFGQPLCDLKLEPAQIWIGVVAPLVVRYILDDDKRLVMVVTPFAPLPGSGLRESP